MRWRRWGAIVLLVALAGYGGWRWQQRRARLAASRAARAEAARVMAALEGVAEVHVVDKPPRNVFDELERKHGIKIDYDPAVPAVEFESSQPWITLDFQGGTLQHALSRIAQAMNPEFVAVPRGGRVLITTGDEAANDLVDETYVLSPEFLGPNGITEERLRETIESCIEPTTWAGVGGFGTIETTPAGLIVAQPPEIQVRIRRLIELVEEAHRHPETTAPLEVQPPTAEELRIEKILDEPSSLNVDTVKLQDVLAELSSKHDLPIYTEAEQRLYTLSLQIEDAPLRLVLQHVGSQLDLLPLVLDSTLQLSEYGYDYAFRTSRVYPCADLLEPMGPYDYDEFTEIVEACIAPTTWMSVGGTGSIEVCGTAVVIAQTPDVHRELEQLFAALRRHAAGQEETLSPERARLEAALRTKCAIDADEVPLAKVIADLARRHDLRMVLDQSALADVNVKPSTAVICHVHDLPLEAGLYHLLRPLELEAYAGDDGVILVTSETTLSEDLPTRVYDVRHLVWPDFHVEPDYDSLIELIESTIEPTTWTNVGGTGVVQEGDGGIVLSQTREVHRKVAELLEALTRLYDEPARIEPITISSLAPEQDREIARRLDQVVSVDWRNVALEEFREILRNEYGVQAILDPHFRDDGRLDPYSMFDCRLNSVTLRSAIAQALRTLELGFYVQHGALVIASDNRIDEDLVTRVYPVADLVYGGERNSTTEPDYDALMDMIEECVAPITWTNVGGTGAIQEYETSLAHALVISHTDAVHRQIERLLATLRHARDPKRFPEPRRTAAEERIDEVLGSRVDLVFSETPLEEVVRTLSERWSVNVVLDVPLRKEAALVTCDLHDCLAVEGLAEMLERYLVTVGVWNECIVLGSEPDLSSVDMEALAETRIYHWNAPHAGGPNAPSFEALSILISELLEPCSWFTAENQDLVGDDLETVHYFATLQAWQRNMPKYSRPGFGDARDYGDALVVYHTPVVHARIADLLRLLEGEIAAGAALLIPDHDLSSEQYQWIVAHLAAEKPDWLTLYAAELGSRDIVRQRDLVEPLVALYERLEPARYMWENDAIYVALARCGIHARAALPRIVARIDDMPRGQRRDAYILLLASFGADAAEPLVRYLSESLSGTDTARAATTGLLALGEKAQGALPQLVAAMVDNRVPPVYDLAYYGPPLQPGQRQEVTVADLLHKIDPDLKETSRLVEQWKASPDELLHWRARLLEKMLREWTDEPMGESPVRWPNSTRAGSVSGAECMRASRRPRPPVGITNWGTRFETTPRGVSAGDSQALRGCPESTLATVRRLISVGLDRKNTTAKHYGRSLASPIGVNPLVALHSGHQPRPFAQRTR